MTAGRASGGGSISVPSGSRTCADVRVLVGWALALAYLVQRNPWPKLTDRRSLPLPLRLTLVRLVPTLLVTPLFEKVNLTGPIRTVLRPKMLMGPRYASTGCPAQERQPVPHGKEFRAPRLKSPSGSPSEGRSALPEDCGRRRRAGRQPMPNKKWRDRGLPRTDSPHS